MILIAVPIVIYGATHVTIFFIVLVGYTEAQMIALSEELLNLWEDAVNDVYLNEGLPANENSVLVDQFIKLRLENISKSHVLNIRLIRQVESTFRSGILLQLMCLSMSLVGNLLAGLETTFSQIPVTMLLIGIDCYTGQNLIDASKAFGAAVYRCKWERFDKSNMRLVLIMLQSTQKTMTVSAGGVAGLDYVSFMFIAKSVYQAYAALQSK
uniref:Odorant receptors OR35.2 n=1 Tax=Lobesia botrana TaxID=209534 RepID=A0A345BEV9_9NEOP|nr:odorant receptors OR35.2 [Lobesia botrana]